MAELISYSFTKANSADIGTEWDDHGSLSGQFEILSNMAHVTSGTNGNDGAETVNSITTPTDQYAEVTLGTTSASGRGTGYGVYCRLATANHTGYRLIGSDDGWELLRFNSGTSASISNGATAFDTGDILYLEITGTSTVSWAVKKNGSAVASGTDTASGSPITAANRVGIGYSSSDATGSGIASFRAGSIGTTSYTLTADQGSYSLTGQTANLARAYVPMAANQGSYGLTGQDATLSYAAARSMPADTGFYTLAGSEALVDIAMNAGLGEYALTGQNATLDYAGLTHRTLTADQGSYTLTGQDVPLFWAHVLQAVQGTYNLLGSSVILRWSEETSAGGIVLVQAITITKLKIGL